MTPYDFCDVATNVYVQGGPKVGTEYIITVHVLLVHPVCSLFTLTAVSEYLTLNLNSYFRDSEIHAVDKTLPYRKKRLHYRSPTNGIKTTRLVNGPLTKASHDQAVAVAMTSPNCGLMECRGLKPPHVMRQVCTVHTRGQAAV